MQNVYETYPFTHTPGIIGYKVSRWSDRAEQEPPSWLDFFAHRPLQILAERLWGGPRSASVWQFFGRTDGIGDAPPTNEVSFSDDGSHWKVATSGRFTDDQTEKEVDWSPAAARYVRLRALSEAGGGQLTSAAELTPLQAPAPDIRSR